MTEKATSEAPACGLEETTSESAHVPLTEPSGDTAAPQAPGGEQAPRGQQASDPQESARQPPDPAASAAPAGPAATDPALPREGDESWGGRGGWGGSHGRERRGARSRLQTPSPPPASPSDVPSAPLLLDVEDVSDSSVTVSWEPPERLGRLGLQGYVLELRREGGELRVKPSYTEGRWAWGAVGTSPQTLQLSQNRGRRRGGVEAVCLSLMDSVLLTYTSLKAGGHPRGLSRCLVLQLQEASE